MATHVFVRERQRRGGRVREGLDYTWTEFQVVNGRHVISRHDTQALAEKAAQRLRERLLELGSASKQRGA